MLGFKLSLKRVMKRMDCATRAEINEIIMGLIRWQEKRFPEYEMVVLSLPKYDQTERKRQIDLLADMLKNMYITKSDNEVTNA